MRTANDYLELPYRITLVHDSDDDGNEGWVASVDELSGCLAQGETPDDAITHVYEAMLAWIESEIEAGHDIPEPRELKQSSGRFLLRLPRSLHAELAHQAEEEGTSLNQLVTGLLAGAVGWRRQKEYA
jgi:antitoxin HicB